MTSSLLRSGGKSLAGVVAFVGLMLSSTPSAVAAPTGLINQGDLIYGEGGGPTCTVGYVDLIHNRIYTAGHCGPTGSQWYTDKMAQEPLGTLTSLEGVRGKSVDLAFIDITETLQLGSNVASGNRPLSPREPRVGETLCIFNPDADAAQCGPLIPSPTSKFFVSPETAARPGHSGAPVWNDEELVGIYLGTVSSGGTGEVIASRILPWTALPPHLQASLGINPVPDIEENSPRMIGSTLGSSLP